jgi:hypothetical protein
VCTACAPRDQEKSMLRKLETVALVQSLLCGSSASHDFSSSLFLLCSTSVILSALSKHCGAAAAVDPPTPRGCGTACRTSKKYQFSIEMVVACLGTGRYSPRERKR